jgi:glycosyltransferase involved in cell wall biosynthesis
MVMQTDILFAPANGADSATGGGSMEMARAGVSANRHASVSVIIPTYRRPDVLPRAITSAQRQTLQPAQILVVDDGSEDDTPSVVRRFSQVTLLQQKNAGPARARNLGLQASQGEYVVSLDHDDEWDETFLESAVTALEAHHADVAWVNFRQTGDYAFANYLETDKRRWKLLPHGAAEEVAIADQSAAMEFFLFSNCAASNSALVFRREALGEGWDPSTQIADDLLVLAHLLLKKRLRYVFVLRPHWTKHEDARSFSQNSEATVQRCLHDFQTVTLLGRDHFSQLNRQRWQHRVGNLRYKLAYHRLWSGGVSAAWAEAKHARREAGITWFALQLLLIALLRACARAMHIPPMSTWRRARGPAAS